MWQREACPPHICQEYNKILDPLIVPFRYVMGTVVGIGILFEILCIKWRFLAHAFIHIESFIMFISGFYPSTDMINMTPFFYMISSVTICCAFYSNRNE
jgi:hypothetical protein